MMSDTPVPRSPRVVAMRKRIKWDIAVTDAHDAVHAPTLLDPVVREEWWAWVRVLRVGIGAVVTLKGVLERGLLAGESDVRHFVGKVAHMAARYPPVVETLAVRDQDVVHCL